MRLQPRSPAMSAHANPCARVESSRFRESGGTQIVAPQFGVRNVLFRAGLPVALHLAAPEDPPTTAVGPIGGMRQQTTS